MTFARPLLLLLLLAVPLLVLLARRARRRRALPVASLILWRRIDLPAAPPREARRAADRLLALRIAVAVLAALGVAGPSTGGGREAPALHVLRDVSPSMEVFEARAEQEVRRIRKALPAGARIEIRRSPDLSDLAAVLAGAADGSVVVMTDHEDPGLPDHPRVVPALVGDPEGSYVGFASAAIADGRFFAVVANWHGEARDVAVRHPGGEETVRIAAGARRSIEGPAPGGRATLEILGEARGYPANRRVVAVEVPARPVPVRVPAGLPPALARGLAVAAFEDDPEAPRAVGYRTAPGPEVALAIATPGGRRPVAGPVAATGPLAPDAAPAPGTPLGGAGPLAPGGEPLLVDREGPLAVLRQDRVEVALDPADPESRWSRDPAFPIFLAEAARLLGSEPAASQIVEGIADPGEFGIRPAARPADLGALILARGEGSPPADLSPWLCLLAAAGAAAHVLLEGRGRKLKAGVGAGR